MTKMKSKKMTKSTFAIIIMGIVMVAMLAFGGTFAYFTATNSSKNASFTTGTVKLGANTVATVEGLAVSGKSVLDGAVTVASASNVDTYVFVTFTVGKIDGAEPVANKAAYDAATGEAYFVQYEVGSDWTAITGKTGVYGKKVAANTSDPLTVCDSIVFWGKSASTEAATGSLMGKSIKIEIVSEAIQAFSEATQAAFADANAAYNALHA